MNGRKHLNDYPDILSVPDLASLLGVSTKTVYKIIADNQLQCIKVGRAYKIPKSNVLKFLRVNS